MKPIYSPDGTAEIIPHPSKKQQMLDDGWTEEKPKNSKPSAEKKSVDKKEES